MSLREDVIRVTAFGDAALLDQRCRDEARRNGAHTDILRAIFDGGGFRQADHALPVGAAAPPMPALLTPKSRRPKCATAASIDALTSDSLVTSACTNSASLPAAFSSSASVFPGPSSTSEMTTLAPSRANAR